MAPDEVIHGKGDDYEERRSDQFEQALSYVEKQGAPVAARPEAA